MHLTTFAIFSALTALAVAAPTTCKHPPANVPKPTVAPLCDPLIPRTFALRVDSCGNKFNGYYVTLRDLDHALDFNKTREPSQYADFYLDGSTLYNTQLKGQVDDDTFMFVNTTNPVRQGPPPACKKVKDDRLVCTAPASLGGGTLFYTLYAGEAFGGDGTTILGLTTKKNYYSGGPNVINTGGQPLNLTMVYTCLL